MTKEESKEKREQLRSGWSVTKLILITCDIKVLSFTRQRKSRRSHARAHTLLHWCAELNTLVLYSNQQEKHWKRIKFKFHMLKKYTSANLLTANIIRRVKVLEVELVFISIILSFRPQIKFWFTKSLLTLDVNKCNKDISFERLLLFIHRHTFIILDSSRKKCSFARSSFHHFLEQRLPLVAKSMKKTAELEVSDTQHGNTHSSKDLCCFLFEFYCETFNVLYTGVHRPYRTCPACIIIIIKKNLLLL